jgi:tetratricopeptide (TPR) repeat protein
LIWVGLCLLLVSCREIVEKEAAEKLAEAEAALYQKQWAAASESFHDAILLDPDRSDAWIGRGMTLTQMGDTEEARVHYEEALSICRKTLKVDPLAQEAIRRQIMLLVLLNRANEASALASLGAEAQPDSEFFQELPRLVAEISRDFEKMILPDAPQ